MDSLGVSSEMKEESARVQQHARMSMGEGRQSVHIEIY